MIERWLDLPAAGVFAVLAVLYSISGAAITWVCFGTPFAKAVHKFDGVVAPFFGAVGILFALLTGFLTADIAERNRQATRAVQDEVNELRNVFTLSVAAASDMRNIRAAWTRYVTAVVKDEWPLMTHGGQAASASAAFDELERNVSDPKIANEAGVAVQSALLNTTVRVGTARSDRLALSSERTYDLKWAMVLMLGVMTQISIAMVHLERRNAHIAAMIVFSASAVITLGLIALQERPFSGSFGIEPWQLQELLKLAGAG